MVELNFPKYQFRIKHNTNRDLIFDIVRKKYIALTPEEWVRQHVIKYLNEKKLYPVSLMAVEASVKVNRLSQRADIVIYSKTGIPKMIIECKAPSVTIDQKVFDQAARYNMSLNANYFLLTNGVNHYCAIIDYKNNSYSFIPEIPEFKMLE
ncbi:MAG: type I restriction enzyme HsdR N-terminal domain-containing protein [Marinilabiliaceae bacterium]|nr:type I restriction enzyme HsdR N-terminal domain-containing protein [Marinilabiliaceae bacterium]